MIYSNILIYLIVNFVLYQVWDLNTLQSIMTLNGHSDVVTSLIFWDQCLISCSLDCTIKVWAETGNLEATYTPTQERVCYFYPFSIFVI